MQLRIEQLVDLALLLASKRANVRLCQLALGLNSCGWQVHWDRSWSPSCTRANWLTKYLGSGALNKMTSVRVAERTPVPACLCACVPVCLCANWHPTP
jgi:hypothetical protein